MLANKKKAAEFNNVMCESEIEKRLIGAHSFCGVIDESDDHCSFEVMNFSYINGV